MANTIDLNKSAFIFIADKTLREDLEDALLFAMYLIDTAQKATEKRYHGEFNRVIVLYIAAVVEALCLFLLEKSGTKKERTEYKDVVSIHNDRITIDNGELIMAIKSKKRLELRDIPFVESISLLYGAGKINVHLKNRLSSLREKRNSQHLYSREKDQIFQKDVSESIKTLVMLQRIIENLN
jgi:hypothetical protein